METTACDLFRRCLERRDPDDWNAFIGRYRGRVYAVTRRVLVRQGVPHVDQEIDEFVQELYLRLWLLDDEGFRGRTSEQLWQFLSRIVRHLAIDFRRHDDTVERCRELLDVEPPPASPERRAMARQDLRGVFERFRRAAREFRVELKLRVLRLAYCDGCSSPEIVRELRGRMTSSQVDSMIHRLRRRLAEEGLVLCRRHLSATAG